MSETETYLAELEEAEARAAGLLEDAGPDGGDLDQRARATIKHLREALKRHRNVVDTIRAEARTAAHQELVRERQMEAGFRRLSVPESARALFSDVDPTDQAAMTARSDELRQARGDLAGAAAATRTTATRPKRGSGGGHAGGGRRHHPRVSRRLEDEDARHGGQPRQVHGRAA